MFKFGHVGASAIVAALAVVIFGTSSQGATAPEPNGGTQVVRQNVQVVRQNVQVAPENVTSQTAGSPAVQPQALFLCNFNQAGDWVHISTWNDISGAAPVASAHGWWENVNCSAKTATVTVQLQAYVNGAWHNYGIKGTKSPVYSGGGSSNRAAAQAECISLVQRVQWRSVIDVDLIGQDDAPNKLTTPATWVYCKPNG